MTTVQSPSPTSHGAHYSALSVVIVPFYTHLRRGLYLIPIWRTKPLWLWNGPANTTLPRYSILPTSSAFVLILVKLSSVLTLVCIRTFLGTCALHVWYYVFTYLFILVESGLAADCSIPRLSPYQFVELLTGTSKTHSAPQSAITFSIGDQQYTQNHAYYPL